mgnify:FL=1
MVKAYLGLGSNIGNRELQLNEAIKILHDYQGIQVTQVSHIYETEPVGYTNQPKFLNLCIEIETELNPQSLLKCCLTTEQQLHRKREIRWGPRTLDIDILLLDNQIIEQDNLSVTNHIMKERSFVLIPLNDIATNQIEPISNKSIGQLVVPDNSVKKYKE